jgi:hypothetical protein
MSGTLVLPPELHDIIIGFLYDDIPTLASCALVCKDWLPSSRCHLFRRLELKPWTARKFLRLLESPLHGPAIAPHVRNLYIHEGLTQVDAWFNEGVWRMGILRSVTSLHVDLLDWEVLSVESRVAFMSFLHNVEELILTDSDFETFDQFTEVVSEPRSLRKLEVRGNNSWEDGPTMELDRLPCPNQLQALHLEGCQDPLFPWLLQHESCYRMLKILKVDDQSVEAVSVELFGRFLRALGSTLESLDVQVSDGESSPVCRYFDFHRSA